MSNKHLLIISKDYWGVESSEKIANRFSNVLSELLDIPNNNITHHIGNITVNTVKQTIYSFIHTSLSNNNYTPILYIYINGHGNQVYDNNGDEVITSINENETNIDAQDEIYQLPDGNLLDDELTNTIDIAVYNSNCIDRPTIILFSDHCSSGSMIDKSQRYFDWCSIGSSLDNQDSFVDGDGNVMTQCLINVLEGNKEILHELTSINLFNLLNNEMKNSFIGELQTPTFHVSDLTMMTFKLFHN